MDTISTREVPAERRRKSYSDEEKRRIVAESYEPGASVSVVARRYDINANLVFTWRRQMRDLAPATAPLELIPIEMIGPASSPPPPTETAPRGVIEVVLVSGVRVRVDAGVNEPALKRVLSALKAVA